MASPTSPLPLPVPIRWGWLLALGIALLVGGTFALTVSNVATLASVLVLGWLLLFTGAIETVYAFTAPRFRGVLLHVVNGVISVVAGFLLVQRPGEGALVLTLLIAMFLLIGGLFRTIGGIVTDLPHRGWVILNGVISLALGALVFQQLPGAALWLIGTFVGIDMIFSGWTSVMLALALRSGRTHVSAVA